MIRDTTDSLAENHKYEERDHLWILEIMVSEITHLLSLLGIIRKSNSLKFYMLKRKTNLEFSHFFPPSEV